jgi:hypothetical protein
MIKIDANDLAILNLDGAIRAKNPANHTVTAPLQIDNRAMRAPATRFVTHRVASVGD